MNFIDCVKSSIRNIMYNKIRSFLTMLGIIIGISSVIIVVALGRGSTNQITSEFEKMGAKTLNIRPNLEKAGKQDLLTIDDIKTIQDSDPDIETVSPQDQMTGSLQLENNKEAIYIYFVNQDFRNIGGINVIYGRYFNQKEYESSKQYIVIDSLTSEKLFKTANSVGRDIRVNVGGTAKIFNIIGVFDISPYYSGIGSLANNVTIPGFVFIPFTCKQDLGLYNKNCSMISAILKDLTREGEVADNIVKTLSIKHDNLGKNIYIVEKATNQMAALTNILSIVTTLVIAVAAISLIVGGIGVMNIMLVSVTERTREIGTRKALGATTNDIMTQFLVEATVLCFIGGVIGIAFGLTTSSVIARFANMQSSPSILMIFVSIIFSSLIGLFFGIYPAKKASDLNPIDSLRFE
ncbi:MAG: ABC transporter permease [Oscillospiraceae bacterium]|nr:ABC transporter permease [Oscillospiraceae bacterium]